MSIKHRIIRRLLIITLLITPVILLGCNSYSMFYYPDNKNYGSRPENKDIPYEEIYFISKDGTQLRGWFVPSLTTRPENATGTVIHIHGNAGNLTGHWNFVDWLPERGFNLFLFDYRGYGESEGKPSPQGLLEDTQGAINYILSREDINSDRLVIFAQSLGGNNAIAALGDANQQLQILNWQNSENDIPVNISETNVERRQREQAEYIHFLQKCLNVKALAIDSTFYSYAAIAGDTIPGSGIFFNREYSAEYYIDKIPTIPLLFIHNKGDSMIPYSHSVRLFEKAREPKQLILVEGGGHIRAMLDYGLLYQNAMVDFFEQVLIEKNNNNK